MEPTIIEENVLLRLKLNKLVVSDDGVDEVVLSRHNNAIIELRNGKIVSSFKFDQPVTVVQQLKIFFSYKPKFKHYLFMNGSDLIILRKTDTIIFVKMYNEVTNYEITDECNSGKPHVVIHVANQESPIVTDCITVKLFPPSAHNHVHAFGPYIKKSMLRIKNAEKILEEKTKVISKLSNVLAFNCDDDMILSSTDQIVSLKEGLASSFTGLAAKGNALSVGEPWLKTHLGKWIIGFPIVNISNHDIFSFEMFINHHCVNVKKTLLFTKTNKIGEMDFYGQSIKLFIQQFGILVAVVQEPHLIPETFNLTCVSRFENANSEEPEQCFLGLLEVNTSELEKNQHNELFYPHFSSTHDLISIQAASKSFELLFKSTLTISDLVEKLESLLSARRISDHVFLNSHTSGKFPCLLLILDPNCNLIRAFANTENDFLLLTHKLTDSLRGIVTFEHPKTDSLDAVVTTLKEIKYIKGMIIHELIGSESSCSPSPPIDLEEAFRDMMLLEIESAAAMNSLKMYS